MFRKNLYLSCSDSLDVLIGAKIKKERAQLLVNTKKIIKKPEYDLEEDDQEVLKDQNYVEVLGRHVQGICGVRGVVVVGVGSVRSYFCEWPKLLCRIHKSSLVG